MYAYSAKMEYITKPLTLYYIFLLYIFIQRHVIPGKGLHYTHASVVCIYVYLSYV